MKHLKNRCTICKDLKMKKIQRQKWGKKGLIMFVLKKTLKDKILIKLTKPRNMRRFSKGGRDWQLIKISNSQNHQGDLPEAKLDESQKAKEGKQGQKQKQEQKQRS